MQQNQQFNVTTNQNNKKKQLFKMFDQTMPSDCKKLQTVVFLVCTTKNCFLYEIIGFTKQNIGFYNEIIGFT